MSTAYRNYKGFLTGILVALIVPSGAWAANVYNYFAPTQAGAGSTCAANQVWFLNSAGTLVSCSTNFVWDDINHRLTVTGTTALPADLELVNPNAPANQRRSRMTTDSTGGIHFYPILDNGTIQSNSAVDFNRTTDGFTGLNFTWNAASAGTPGPGSFNVTNTNDVKLTGQSNTQPLLIVQDPGNADALAGVQALASTLSLTAYCAGPAFSLGAGLTNGPTNNYCMLSSGDQLFSPSNAPLIFGANGIYGGQLDVSQNWVLDRATTHATTQTNGFVYLPKTAGVPTGVPANLAGLYATSSPVIFDSTDNRLYAYNSGWQNLSPTPTALANPTGLIGLSAVNGAATTATRSDGHAAIDQGIAPNWTAQHNFNGGMGATGALNIFPNGSSGAVPEVQMVTTAGSGGGILLGTRAAPLITSAASSQHTVQVNVDATGVPGGIAQTFFARNVSTATNAVTDGLEIGNDTVAHELFMGTTSTTFTGAFLTHGLTGETKFLTTADAHPLCVGTAGAAGWCLNASNGFSVYGPTNGALIDVTPDQGSFTATLTGCTAGTTGTMFWQRIGNIAYVWLTSALTCTSNTTAMTVTGLPAAIQSANAHGVTIQAMQDNSVAALMGGMNASGATLIFQKFNVATGAMSSSGFTAAGTKGLGVAFMAGYPLL